MARNKYHNRKVSVDGHTFDSKAEARRYGELKYLQRAKVIRDLELQPIFVLQEKFKKNGKTHRAITYRADFRYYDVAKKKVVVEDVKGKMTKDFRIKWKLFEKRYRDLELTIINAR